MATLDLSDIWGGSIRKKSAEIKDEKKKTFSHTMFVLKPWVQVYMGYVNRGACFLFHFF